MRDEACRCWQELFTKNPFVFLTGDLGFGALEPLREMMGKSFINSGVAEQNMISVASGMAAQGCNTWVYSIAPFCYARPFEQIRNDICFHNFPVKIVGNGGGYGYGAMGASHHALEDYGVLLTLPGLRVYVPAFKKDLKTVINKLAGVAHPAYLRLGRCEKPENIPDPTYAPLRKLREGNGPVLLIIGPLVGGIMEALEAQPEENSPELWLVSELPLSKEELCGEFTEVLRQKRKLCVVEEHVAHGGLGQYIAHFVATEAIALNSFRHCYAKNYPSGNYGSQIFHRRENGLNPQAVLQLIENM